MIKVLIVDDSHVAREFLTYILSSDPEIKVVGSTDSGYKAIDLIRRTSPDVVTIDIHMPILDGAKTTRMIMEQAPVPIVVVSETARTADAAFSFTLLEAGALAVMLRPPAITNPKFETAHSDLIQTLKAMAEQAGPDAMGIILTGMGRDGAEALRLMKEMGAMTIAQNKKSSIIFGMPAEAIKLGAADFVLNPLEIAEMMTRQAQPL